MRSKGLVILALLAGAVAAAAVLAYMGAVRAEADEARAEALKAFGGQQVEVLVALRDLAPGELVDASNAEARTWVVELLPEDAVHSVDDVAGQKLGSAVVAGEVVSKRHFEGAQAVLSVPSGYEALTVEVDKAAGLGGALDVGSRVDVYAAGADRADPLVRGVTVLALGSDSSRLWVTLALRPENVPELVAATGSTTLYFTLPSQVRGAALGSAAAGAQAGGSGRAGDGADVGAADDDPGAADVAGAGLADAADGGAPQGAAADAAAQPDRSSSQGDAGFEVEGDDDER